MLVYPVMSPIVVKVPRLVAIEQVVLLVLLVLPFNFFPVYLL